MLSITTALKMDTSSTQLSSGDSINILTADDNAVHGLFLGCDETGPYLAVSDGTTTVKEYTTFDRKSYLLIGMSTPTESTFQLNWQRFDSDGVAIDNSLQSSTAHAYDGSFDPGTALTLFKDNTVPIGLVGVEILNELTDDLTSRLIKRLPSPVG